MNKDSRQPKWFTLCDDDVFCGVFWITGRMGPLGPDYKTLAQVEYDSTLPPETRLSVRVLPGFPLYASPLQDERWPHSVDFLCEPVAPNPDDPAFQVFDYGKKHSGVYWLLGFDPEFDVDEGDNGVPYGVPTGEEVTKICLCEISHDPALDDSPWVSDCEDRGQWPYDRPVAKFCVPIAPPSPSLEALKVFSHG